MYVMTMEDLDAKRRYRVPTVADGIWAARRHIDRLLGTYNDEPDVEPVFFSIRDANAELVAFVGLLDDRSVRETFAAAHLRTAPKGEIHGLRD
jgi:hypothetical protein